ncbi:hypothetical protein F4775DRAFT_590418 [Biscogniauxia sp. FL1348]|nr:hypothetical protein F4775DRAFT_590418 [Biscogniauxia sp. FL1348]
MYSSSSAVTAYREAAAASLLPVLARAHSTGADRCTDVHTFLTRCHNEPGCNFEDTVLNNALETECCSAVQAGHVAGCKQITAYHERFSDTKLVISGYSRGAHVFSDILGGSGISSSPFFLGCNIKLQRWARRGLCAGEKE